MQNKKDKKENKMNRQNEIILTEQELHYIVENSVKEYLTEAGFWGGVGNAWYGMRGGNFNIKSSYKAGKWASAFNKYAGSAQASISDMQEIAKESGNAPIATALGRISKQMQKVADNFNKMAKSVARPPMPSTKVDNPWATKTKTKAAPRKKPLTP